MCIEKKYEVGYSVIDQPIKHFVIKCDGHRFGHHATAPDMARALTQSGWLPQFRVFNSLHQAGLAAEDDSNAWVRRSLPQSARRRTRALAM